MPTPEELKGNIQEDITNKTTPGTISPEDVGDNMEAIVDYVDQEVAEITEDLSDDFTEFIATLTQTGTGAPTVTVKKNTLAYVPTIGYVGVGNIGILMTDLVAANTRVTVSPKTGAAKILVPTYSISGNTISLKTYNLANSAFENDMLVDTPIHIRVYA